MDKIEEITEGYEKFLRNMLLETKGIYPIDRFYLITEERGLNFSFRDIVITLYQSIGNFGWRKENDILISEVPYIGIDKSFITDVTLEIQLLSKNAKFEDYAITDFSDIKYNELDNKIHYIRFIYYQYDNAEHKIDNLQFMKSMWHELQHAYRQYKVLKSETLKGEENKKETTRLINYNNNFEIDNTFIASIFYNSDIDEINSQMTEMFPYLENHNEINFNNYSDYIKNIPGYDAIQILKSLTYNFDYGIKIEEFREKLCDICRNNIFKTNISDVEVIRRTRNRLNRSLQYAIKQFYKILSNSLEKLNRDNKYKNFLIRKNKRIFRQK